MNPETSGYLRHLLTGVGVMMVSLGWLEADKVEALVGTVMSIVVPIVGVVVTVVPFYLSYRAKQAASTEAKEIAIKVVETTVSDAKGAPVVAEIEAGIVK